MGKQSAKRTIAVLTSESNKRATTMASFLGAFNARLATYVAELEQLQTRNSQEHAFHPTFWMEHQDFTLARDVFVAVRSYFCTWAPPCSRRVLTPRAVRCGAAAQASGSIGHQVTKFSLVYSKTPSQEEGESICKALDEPCEQLLAATKVALFCGAGPSLATEIITDSM